MVPPRACPNCEAMIPPGLPACPNCGAAMSAPIPLPSVHVANIAARGSVFDIIGRVLWFGASGCTFLSAANFIGTYSRRSQEISAPQLAALSAETLVIAVLPYVFARAWDEITR